MSRKSAERKIAVILKLAENNRGFTLSLTDEDDHSASVVLEREKERARTPQEDNYDTHKRSKHQRTAGRLLAFKLTAIFRSLIHI